MTSRISVIIPTAHRRELLLRFIDSLNLQSTLCDELIVVDGAGSADDERAYRGRLRSEVPLRYLRSEMGLTRQRNRGCSIATGDFLFFFDDDVVLEPDYLKNALSVFEAPGNERVGALSGMITNNRLPAKPPRFAARLHRAGEQAIRRAFYLMRAGDGRFLPSGMPTFLTEHLMETDCECLFGCCMAFRRIALKEQLFDERLSRYCYMEDDDIAYRVSRTMRVRYVPSARCQHLQGPANRLTRFAAAKMLLINHHYLFRKNFPSSPRGERSHRLSLVGYPLLMAWNLDWRRFAGATAGLVSILRGTDPLSMSTSLAVHRP